MEARDNGVAGEIEFILNCKKTVEAILYVINQAGGEINQYNLLKIIFAADKYHLNNYARPVTGDKYFKKEYGTVPQAIYDMLNKRNLEYYLNEIDADELPFKINHKGRRYIISSAKEANTKYLSKTDIESLQHGIKEYRGLSFQQVMNKNHEEKCWLNTPDNQPIAFELMIEDPDTLEHLNEHPYGNMV